MPTTLENPNLKKQQPNPDGEQLAAELQKKIREEKAKALEANLGETDLNPAEKPIESQVSEVLDSAKVQEVVDEVKHGSDSIEEQMIVENNLPKASKEKVTQSKKNIESAAGGSNSEQQESETNPEILRRRFELAGQIQEMMNRVDSSIKLPNRNLWEDFSKCTTLEEFRAVVGQNYNLKQAQKNFAESHTSTTEQPKKWYELETGLEQNLASAKAIGNAFAGVVNAVAGKANRLVTTVNPFSNVPNLGGQNIVDRVNDSLASKLNWGSTDISTKKVPTLEEVKDKALAGIPGMMEAKKAEMKKNIEKDKKLNSEQKAQYLKAVDLYIKLETEDLQDEINDQISDQQFLMSQGDLSMSLGNIVAQEEAASISNTGINFASSAALMLAGGPIGLGMSLVGRVTAANLQNELKELSKLLNEKGGEFGEFLLQKDNPESGALASVGAILENIKSGQATFSESQAKDLDVLLRTILAESRLSNHVFGRHTETKIKDLLDILSIVKEKQTYGGENTDLSTVLDAIKKSKSAVDEIRQAYTVKNDPKATKEDREKASEKVDKLWQEAKKRDAEGVYEIPVPGKVDKEGNPLKAKLNKRLVRWGITMGMTSFKMVQTLGKLAEEAALAGIELDDAGDWVNLAMEKSGENFQEKIGIISDIGLGVGETIADIPGELAELADNVKEMSVGIAEGFLNSDPVAELREMTGVMFDAVLSNQLWDFLQKSGVPVIEINQKLREVLADFFPSEMATVNTFEVVGTDGEKINSLLVSDHIPDEMMSWYRARGFVVADTSETGMVLVPEDKFDLIKNPDKILENISSEQLAGMASYPDLGGLDGIHITEDFVTIDIPKDDVLGVGVDAADVPGLGMVGNRQSGEIFMIQGKPYMVDSVVFNEEGDYKLVLTSHDMDASDKAGLNKYLIDEMGDGVMEREWSNSGQSRIAFGTQTMSVNRHFLNSHPELSRLVPENTTDVQKINTFSKSARWGRIEEVTSLYFKDGGNGYKYISFRDVQKMNDKNVNITAVGDPKKDQSIVDMVLAREVAYKDSNNIVTWSKLFGRMQPGSRLIIGPDNVPFITFNTENSADLISNIEDETLYNYKKAWELATKDVDLAMVGADGKTLSADKIDTLNKRLEVFTSELIDREIGGKIYGNENSSNLYISLKESAVKAGSNLTDAQIKKAKREMAEIIARHIEDNGYTRVGGLSAIQSGTLKINKSSELIRDFDLWMKSEPFGFPMEEENSPFIQKFYAAFGGERLDAGETAEFRQSIVRHAREVGYDGWNDVVGKKFHGYDMKYGGLITASDVGLSQEMISSYPNREKEVVELIDTIAKYQKFTLPISVDGSTGHRIVPIAHKLNQKIYSKLESYGNISWWESAKKVFSEGGLGIPSVRSEVEEFTKGIDPSVRDLMVNDIMNNPLVLEAEESASIARVIAGVGVGLGGLSGATSLFLHNYATREARRLASRIEQANRLPSDETYKADLEKINKLNNLSTASRLVAEGLVAASVVGVMSPFTLIPALAGFGIPNFAVAIVAAEGANKLANLYFSLQNNSNANQIAEYYGRDREGEESQNDRPNPSFNGWFVDPEDLVYQLLGLNPNSAPINQEIIRDSKKVAKNNIVNFTGGGDGQTLGQSEQDPGPVSRFPDRNERRQSNLESLTREVQEIGDLLEHLQITFNEIRDTRIPTGDSFTDNVSDMYSFLNVQYTDDGTNFNQPLTGLQLKLFLDNFKSFTIQNISGRDLLSQNRDLFTKPSTKNLLVVCTTVMRNRLRNNTITSDAYKTILGFTVNKLGSMGESIPQWMENDYNNLMASTGVRVPAVVAANPLVFDEPAIAETSSEITSFSDINKPLYTNSLHAIDSNIDLAQNKNPENAVAYPDSVVESLGIKYNLETLSSFEDFDKVQQRIESLKKNPKFTEARIAVKNGLNKMLSTDKKPDEIIFDTLQRLMNIKSLDYIAVKLLLDEASEYVNDAKIVDRVFGEIGTDPNLAINRLNDSFEGIGLGLNIDQTTNRISQNPKHRDVLTITLSPEQMKKVTGDENTEGTFKRVDYHSGFLNTQRDGLNIVFINSNIENSDRVNVVGDNNVAINDLILHENSHKTHNRKMAKYEKIKSLEDATVDTALKTEFLRALGDEVLAHMQELIFHLNNRTDISTQIKNYTAENFIQRAAETFDPSLRGEVIEKMKAKNYDSRIKDLVKTGLDTVNIFLYRKKMNIEDIETREFLSMHLAGVPIDEWSQYLR